MSYTNSRRAGVRVCDALQFAKLSLSKNTFVCSRYPMVPVSKLLVLPRICADPNRKEPRLLMIKETTVVIVKV